MAKHSPVSVASHNPRNYYRPAPVGKWGLESSKTDGELCVGDDNLLSVVESAERAGIPKKNWNQIKQEKDYTGCCYESDEPSTVWRFPLSLLDS